MTLHLLFTAETTVLKAQLTGSAPGSPSTQNTTRPNDDRASSRQHTSSTSWS
jgi:hypothetical protein